MNIREKLRQELAVYVSFSLELSQHERFKNVPLQLSTQLACRREEAQKVLDGNDASPADLVVSLEAIRQTCEEVFAQLTILKPTSCIR